MQFLLPQAAPLDADSGSLGRPFLGLRIDPGALLGLQFGEYTGWHRRQATGPDGQRNLPETGFDIERLCRAGGPNGRGGKHHSKPCDPQQTLFDHVGAFTSIAFRLTHPEVVWLASFSPLFHPRALCSTTQSITYATTGTKLVVRRDCSPAAGDHVGLFV